MKAILLRTFALAYTVFVLSMTYLILPLEAYLKKKGSYKFAIRTLCYLFLAGILYLIWKRRHILTPIRIVCTLVVIALYVVHYLRVSFEIERAHLVEYSLLAIILNRALALRFSKLRNLVDTALISILIGCLDEFIQRFIPGREGTIGDVYLGAISSILGLALTLIFQNNSIKSLEGLAG